MKTCTKCKKEKPLDQYYFRNGPKGSRVPRAQCQDCTKVEDSTYRKGIGKEVKRQWKANNVDKVKASGKRTGWKRIGIDPVLAEAYYLSHDGKCEICGLIENSGRALAMDHCHKTGKIRGMLCQKCNIALGHFKDSPEVMLRALAYLKNSRL